MRARASVVKLQTVTVDNISTYFLIHGQPAMELHDHFFSRGFMFPKSSIIAKRSTQNMLLISQAMVWIGWVFSDYKTLRQGHCTS